MSNSKAIISVIIPSFNRSDLLRRAIASVLAQTMGEFEIIVVTSKNDRAVDVVASFTDQRLRTITTDAIVLGGRARNLGILHARGEFVAFLDDDDEWHPSKLAEQLHAANSATTDYVLVLCRTIARTPLGDYVYPRRLPDSSKSLGDYLFRRESMFSGDTLIQTSCIFVSRKLVSAVLFNPELTIHQDWDLVLRLSAHPGITIIYLPEALAIWNIEDSRVTVGSSGSWEASLNWVISMKALLSKQAMYSFLMTEVLKKTPLKYKSHIVAAAVRHGRLMLLPTLIALGQLITSAGVRRRIRLAFYGEGKR